MQGPRRSASASATTSAALTRASLAFVVCGVVLVLLWRGWFPDLRAPGADLRRVGDRDAC